MGITKGIKIVNDFVYALNALNGITINQTIISRNVFELKSTVNYLLYIKGRAAQPYRWGITANVVDKLKSQHKNWCVILLFDSCNKGYLLTPQDVEFYIQNVWPLGRDGDYKPATGSYLSMNVALHSINEIIKQFQNL